MEWCQDTWHGNYDNAPPDGSSWEDENNEARVLRGGSCNHGSGYVRSSARNISHPDDRYDGFGVRVLCSAHIGIYFDTRIANRLRLTELRLTIHDQKAQVLPTADGVPWLGFVIYPEFRKVKARKVRHATRHLGHYYHAYCNSQISFAEFDARVQGWINHVRFAD